MPSSFAPFRRRDWTLLWSASLVSTMGSWLQTVAFGAFVVSRTGKASWAGIAAIAAFLPLGLLGPVGGALADRGHRRRWLVGLTCVEAAGAAILAFLASSGRLTPVLGTAVVFAEGCVAALRLPFQQSLQPDLLPPEELLAGASLGSAQFNLGRVVGPAFAGIVVAAGGFGTAFALNAVSFLAVVAAVSFIRIPQRTTADQSLLRGIREGARALAAEPACRAAVGLICVSSFLAAPFISLVAARARDLVDGRAADVAGATGALTAAQGAGGVLGALLVPVLAARLGRGRLITAYLLTTPALLVVYAWTPGLLPTVVAMAVVGAAYIGIISGLSTVVQLRAPIEFRARVMSLFFVSLGVIYPIGGVVQGFVADRIGLAPTTTGFALVMLAVMATLVVRSRHVLRVLADPAEPLWQGSRPATP